MILATLGQGPWWLLDADSTCRSCLQGYAHHVEVRCVDCDGPSCPHCVVRVETREIVCIECSDARAKKHSKAGARRAPRKGKGG